MPFLRLPVSNWGVFLLFRGLHVFLQAFIALPRLFRVLFALSAAPSLHKKPRNSISLPKPLTVRIDEVRQVEIELAHRHIDVVRVDAEARLRTVRILLEPFAVCAL